jgi:metallophosphoesterase (TIGR03767 family)
MQDDPAIFGLAVPHLSPLSAGSTTLSATIGRGEQTGNGYRSLTAGPGEPFGVRRDLGGAEPDRFQPLACFVQLSDLHVTDVQSPARAEFLDRLGDADSAFAPLLGRIGVYRPQETLTAQVVEAMTRAVGRVERGPLTRAQVQFAISTGDATDNCQSNELDTYVGLLNGGQLVSTDSGALGRFEGVGSTEHFDRRYWHPDGSPAGEGADIPRAVYGFPAVPGLLETSLTPFTAVGLPLPWYAVYGNHDALFGGTLFPHDVLAAVACGPDKAIQLSADADPIALLANNELEPSPALWGLLSAPTRRVTPDAARRPVTGQEWIARHLSEPGNPLGHGLASAPAGCCYYGFDVGIIRFLVLDTVNRSGGWQGSIDDAQLDWLEGELIAGSAVFLDASGRRVRHHADNRIFVLVSHHPLETLLNDFSPDGARRNLAPAVQKLLARFGNVVCWVNGHTHANSIQPIRSPENGATGGFWQVTTASHIDWPQQARVVEIALDSTNGDLVIATTMIDHLGLVEPRHGALDEVQTLAGWSRELAANAWQGRIADEPAGRGGPLDRNAILVVPMPFGLPA